MDSDDFGAGKGKGILKIGRRFSARGKGGKRRKERKERERVKKGRNETKRERRESASDRSLDETADRKSK